MTKPQRPRVDLDPNIFKAVVIEATKQGKKPKDLIDLWVRENVSPEVLALLDINPLPKSTNVPINDVPLPEGDKAPLSISPPYSEPLNSEPLLSAEEQIVLEHLKANRTYREIQELEKGKSNVTKSKVQGTVQKFIGMGLFQGGKRGPKARS